MKKYKKNIISVIRCRSHLVLYVFGYKIISIKESIFSFFIRKIQKNKLRKIMEKHANEKIFVMTPFIPYFSPMKQRFQHFAELISKKGYLVFYCTNWFDDKEKAPQYWDDFYQISDNLYLTEAFVTINKEIKDALFYYTPIAWYEKEEFLQSKKNNIIIYDHIDNFSVDGNKETALKNKQRHKEVAPLCDVVSYSSKCLKKDIENLVDDKKQIFIQNAVDYNHFANIKEVFVPQGFEVILMQNKKIIGYHGALTQKWIDFDLIDKAAKTFPQYNIVLVGSTCNEQDDKRLEALLDNNDNIYRFDAVPYEDLPQYTRFFDISIIPFKHGEIALNTNPIKLFENMAMQIPTVVTRDLIECSGYDGVWVSCDDERFVLDIESAFSCLDSFELKEKLKNYALDLTWEKQVDKLLDFVISSVNENRK